MNGGTRKFSQGEKVLEGTCQPIRPPQSDGHRRRRFFLHGALLAFCFLLWLNYKTITTRLSQPPLPIDGQHQPGAPVDFADIIPSEKLEWHPCFYGVFCARLTVPMDYNRPLNESKDNPKVHLALLMVPGKHPIWEKQSKSPLLMNPGGPGGPGTLAAMAFGPYMQKVVGEDQDVIGFDPRGIGATTPRTDCFSYTSPGSEEEDQARGLLHRVMWTLQASDDGLVNSSSDSLAKLDYRARAHSKLCQDKDALHGNDSIFRYAHTPSVARDMVSIIDAWDEWAETQRVESCHEQQSGDIEPSNDNRETAALDTKGKLVYWGFSYGTLLEATFAAMFPDRVGRVVLGKLICKLCPGISKQKVKLIYEDGVVHADHYVTPIWEDSIQDADAIFNKFSTYCHEAKLKCALYRSGDKPADVADRFQSVMDRIKKQPITFADRTSNTPVVVTHSHIKSLIFSTLYSPMIWDPVATIVNMLFEGHDEVMADFVLIPELPNFCGPTIPYWAYPSDAQYAIMCSDKRYVLNETIPNLEKRFERMAKESSFADVWMSLMVGCDNWNIEAVDPPMRWDDHPAHKQKPINTSFPLLFVSNTLDPVTPLSAGIAMARKFVDSGLIEQQSEGHCSLAAVSKCTIEKIRKYFLLGEIPAHPTAHGAVEKCEADEWPFHPFSGRSISVESEKEQAEPERMAAFKILQKQSMSSMDWDFWGQKRSSMKLDLAKITQVAN